MWLWSVIEICCDSALTEDRSGYSEWIGKPETTTFGGAGVVEIPEMQKLLHFICAKGFEHHIAANLSSVASAVQEAATRYLGWDTYYHGRDNGAC
ncbi:MAG: hypothetical protein ABSH02_08955 [Candidatus Sulfotelmatobacter sp.]